MNLLLVEPEYYTKYPPLGLLKLSSMYRQRDTKVFFNRGQKPAADTPSKIYVTSLFTYAWKPVHKTIKYYRCLYPNAEILLGGIYATLMPEHAKLAYADDIHQGLLAAADEYCPDYSLAPDWDKNILFATRGCSRRCLFCAVPLIEGRISTSNVRIEDKINDDFKKIILWDNNLLAAPNWKEIITELAELSL